MQTSHSKINHIEVNGNNNIVIQDVSGNSKIYINSDEGARELYEDFKQEIFEIRLLLKQRQEPILQQFAEKIYNIRNAEKVIIHNPTDVNIQDANEVHIHNHKPMEFTSAQRKRIEMLEGLERRLQKRLNEKMKTELRFQLELNLQYTKEGTNETYLKDYYIDSYEEKSAESFEKLFLDYEGTLKRLLILGEAGSGKTVLMLQFGLRLIELAKQNFNYPIPVLLNLATWHSIKDQNPIYLNWTYWRSNTPLSFEEWLEENLPISLDNNSINQELIKEFINEKNFILLLDGLDEINENERKDCLMRVQEFLDNIDKSRTTSRNFPTVIISSRKQEFLDTLTQAPVRATINIAPLTNDLIYKELYRIKQSQNINAQTLLNRINIKPEIIEKLKTVFEVHLALNMATNFDFSKLSTETLVTNYLDQEIKKIDIEEAKTRYYLSFLSSKMKEKKLGISFEIINIQPNWLGNLYLYSLSISIITFIFVTLVSIPLFGTKIGFLFGFIFSFLNFCFISIEKDIKSNEIRNFNLKDFRWRNLIGGAIFGIIVGPLLGFVIDLSLNQTYYYYVINFTLSTSIVTGLASGFFHAKKIARVKNDFQRLFSPITFDFFQISFVFITSFILAELSNYSTEILSFLKIYVIIIFGSLFTTPLFKHIFLVLGLALFKNTPLFFHKFLNKVSHTGIMEKDGGQWRFRHQLIMDALISKRGE